MIFTFTKDCKTNKCDREVRGTLSPKWSIFGLRFLQKACQSLTLLPGEKSKLQNSTYMLMHSLTLVFKKYTHWHMCIEYYGHIYDLGRGIGEEYRAKTPTADYTYNQQKVILFNFNSIFFLFIYFFFFFLFIFLGPHPRHMQVPKLGAESEL